MTMFYNRVSRGCGAPESDKQGNSGMRGVFLVIALMQFSVTFHPARQQKVRWGPRFHPSTPTEGAPGTPIVRSQQANQGPTDSDVRS